MAIFEKNKESYDGLKKAYDKAVVEGVEKFTYDGDEFVTGYAKYLLEYLKSLL